MDDSTKKIIKPPVARTGAQTRTPNIKTENTVASAETTAVADANTDTAIRETVVADIFSQAYQERKMENEAAIQEATDETAEEVPENISEEDAAQKKFNTIFISLIIITTVLLIATCAKIIYDVLHKPEPVEDTTPGITENITSAVLVSPFNFVMPEFTDYPEGIQEKYKPLYAQNQDFIGYLSIPGTSVESPVYQTSNNSYYLKHDNYDAYNKYGVPFLDTYCGVEGLSRNSTIYGHNFDNGLIFDDLHKYQDIEFFIENPVIEYNTLYEDYKWKIIAAFHTNGSASGDNGYLFYYIASDMGDNNFMEFYDEIQQRSYIHTGVDVLPTDKILTLSTCTYFFDRNGSQENARFAVVARLVRDGESEEIDPSLAKQNDNVRYPQLYYDVFGGSNPYANASRWEAGNY